MSEMHTELARLLAAARDGERERGARPLDMSMENLEHFVQVLIAQKYALIELCCRMMRKHGTLPKDYPV